MNFGERVLLRREAFSGRHKLKDNYDSMTYIITSKNDENDVPVYQIQPALGDETKWVNRRRLVFDPRQVEEVSDVLYCNNMSETDQSNEEQIYMMLVRKMIIWMKQALNYFLDGCIWPRKNLN